ncbi:class I SAM-dependent methyltransferase [Ruminococcaceae bacterium OttesenSCG-928-O06]|nr:class I SAM-dependent methyltransferase [Ruminococcaceae bacterium OttesenSCG-928-O06]
MRTADGWQDYQLLDATGGFRLERWGDVLLQRPDPQVIWQTPRRHAAWDDVHALYHRSAKGGGAWEKHKPFPEKWTVRYKDLSFIVSPTGFKHTGLFPEQAANWEVYARCIRAAKSPPKVLNLFGYTGGATLACAAAGAAVAHVDASRGMVAWARENAAASGLADAPVRWLVDDCAKFAAREERRQSRYDGIVMDPPSYGRGPAGEVWKLEEAIWPLLVQTAALLSETPLFFALNSYTTGLAPGVGGYMLQQLLVPKYGGTVYSDEIGLPVAAGGGVLPCGSTALWLADGTFL